MLLTLSSTFQESSTKYTQDQNVSNQAGQWPFFVVSTHFISLLFIFFLAIKKFILLRVSFLFYSLDNGPFCPLIEKLWFQFSQCKYIENYKT